MTDPQPNPGRARVLAVVPILLLAFALRVLALNDLPPGWRDDEVIETTVHAQRVLDGERPLFFVEAEGHEPLYHYLTAGWIALVGHSLPMVRLVSAFFGFLAVAAAYRATADLFDHRTALLTAALIAVSFWALMYSRTKIRHISTLVFALIMVAGLWRTFRAPLQTAWRPALVAGVALGLGLYTYFAALTMPLIVLGFGAWLLLFRRDWRRALLTAGLPLLVGLALYTPLFLAMRSAGGSAERLTIVGAPLLALLDGNPLPVLDNTIRTLGMFAFTGDPEALYNIPGRPVFDVGLGLVFYLALGLTAWRALRHHQAADALLLIWWGAGLSPDFVSLPAASLGHALVAQPATCLILARGLLWPLGQPWPDARWQRFARVIPILALALISLRDGFDYALRWPNDPVVRLLYRADLHQRLQADPPAGEVLFGSDLSLWDIRAFTLDADLSNVDARWVNPDHTWVFFGDQTATLWLRNPSAVPDITRFDFWPGPATAIDYTELTNGIYVQGTSFAGGNNRNFLVHLWIGPDFQPPELVIDTSPEAPPQPWRTFVHLYDTHGEFAYGLDLFTADLYTLQPGDQLVTYFPLDAPSGFYDAVVGMYDYTTGQRFITATGDTELPLGEVYLP